MIPRAAPRSVASIDPPLDPSPDDARSWLRRELLRPEYHEQNLVERLLTWLERQVGRGLTAASDTPPLSALAAMVVLVLLVGGLGWLLSRARWTARVRTRERAVLVDQVLGADELRARAEAALADGRAEDALVDAFRALAVRQVEAGRIDDAPGATAHEVAAALAAAYPSQRERVRSGADLFDTVLYGGRRATLAQAGDVLALDSSLTGAR